MCNKKAVIIGGSNGIGLAISKKLLDCGYDLEICDRIPPEEGILEETKVTYHFCDLMDFDEDLYQKLAQNQDVELLMVTAGIGRIADFQYHHIAEIDKMLTVDAVSTIKIFRIFYERILAKRISTQA